MKNFIKNIELIYPKEILAVEASYIAENRWQFNLINVKKLKRSVQCDNAISGIQSQEELFKLLKPITSVCLVVTGKGIINRKITVQNNDDDEKIIRKIFPDAQLKDFMTQVYDINDNLKLLSIARIDIIKDLVELFSQHRVTVVNVDIGPFGVNHILPLLSYADTLLCNAFTLKIKDKHISDFEPSENTEEIRYKVGTATISSYSLIAFASGINYLLNFNEPGTSGLEMIENNKKEHYYAGLFKYCGWAALLFFFLLLLVNWLLFDKYNKKYQDISSRVTEYNFLLSRYDTLNNDLKSKKKFLEESGLLNNIRLSFFADRMVSELPKPIRLTELNIFPLKEKQQKIKKAEFVKNSIFVRGLTQNGTYLNDWVKIIKTYTWISEVNILDFNQENYSTPASFNLEIKIK